MGSVGMTASSIYWLRLDKKRRTLYKKESTLDPSSKGYEENSYKLGDINWKLLDVEKMAGISACIFSAFLTVYVVLVFCPR
jgi:hypothetical protein